MTESHPLNDERLSAYLDGELPDEQLASFEQLLQSRADYRQALDELRILRDRLRSMPSEKLDAGFADRVLRQAEMATLTGGRAETTLSPHSKSTGWSRGAMLAAAATLAVTIAGTLLLPGYLTKSPMVAMSDGDDDAAEGAGEAGSPLTAFDDEAIAGADEPAIALEERLVAPAPMSADEIADATIEPGEVASPMMDEADGEAMRARSPEGPLPEFARAPSRARSAAAGSRSPTAPGTDSDRAPESTPSLLLVSVQDRQLQELARQARQLLNDAEPQSAGSDQWDVVLAAELRDETDWSGLQDSLADNSMSVSTLSPADARNQRESIAVTSRAGGHADLGQAADEDSAVEETESESMSGEGVATNGGQQAFAIRQDATEFMSKLQQAQSKSFPSEPDAPRSDVMTRSENEPVEVETHLLYVEGTRAQMNRFVESLSGSQSSAVVRIAQDDVQLDLLDLDEALSDGDSDRSKQRDSAIVKKSANPSGRAVHLGQSPIRRSFLNLQASSGAGFGVNGLSANEQQHQPASSLKKFKLEPNNWADQQAKGRANNSTDDDDELVQGLIILQDLSAAVDSPSDTLTPGVP